MKKIFLFLLIPPIALLSCVEIPKEISRSENGHNYVDMGTSVMWSPVNLGATVIGEYGDYYAWGELETKEYYADSTYKWYDIEQKKYTKYVLNDNKGTTIDNLTTLELEDDVAHIKWGGTWRMPTEEEMQELIDKCNFEYKETEYGPGFLVTAKNNNRMFLPLSMIWDDGVKWGYYWTSSLSTETDLSYVLWLTDDNNARYEGRYEIKRSIRYIDFNIRPVCVPKSE
jgi:hypothetical protein